MRLVRIPIKEFHEYTGQVCWGYTIHRLHYCKRVNSPNDCPLYDTKESDGEVPEILEL